MSPIPPEVLSSLNRGEVESRTLVEGLAVDFAILLRAVCPQLPRTATEVMRAAQAEEIAPRMMLAGQIMLQQLGPTGYLTLARHRSDTVRSWAAYLLAASPDFSLGERLQLIRPLANDRNGAVRDWAWRALRKYVAANVETAIVLMEAWTVSASPFLRRFVIEATRPVGTHCEEIPDLLVEPSLGLPLIEPLRTDPHQYVQDSVANWLDDLSQAQPDWVGDLCERWLAEGPHPSTERICQGALRNLG